MKQRGIWSLDTKQFQEIVNECNNLSEIIEKSGARVNGTTYRTLHKRIAKEKIDISHIPIGPNANKGRKKGEWKRPIEYYLCRKRISSGINLKKRLIEEGLLKEECAVCKLKPMWNNEKLVLQLDHIDGDFINNTLENLRLICPNCHSQTKTFAGRNVKRDKLVNTCEKCFAPICQKAILCRTCNHEKMRKERVKFDISREELKKLSNTYSAYKIAEMFNVGQTTVLRRMKQYNL